MFKVQPSDFGSDIEYANAIIKKVRRTHSIDDRLENARRESISTNHTTRNIWPTSLSCPLVKNGPVSPHELQDHYFVKAIVPVQKQTYQITYCADNLTAKPKFKLFGDGERVQDQVIFGVLTANNFAGQIPPVQICDQNHDAGAAWYAENFDEDGNQKSFEDRKSEEAENAINQNYQFTYSFLDVQSDFKTKPVDADAIMLHLRDKTYEEGWLQDHDDFNEDAIKLNLKALNIPDLMDQILKFNEILFQ